MWAYGLKVSVCFGWQCKIIDLISDLVSIYVASPIYEQAKKIC